MSQSEELQNGAMQWNRYADLYDRNMGDTGDSFHRETIDPGLIEVIGDVRACTVLDAGCGNGYLARRIASMGADRVIGIDWSSRLIQLANARFSGPNVKFQVSDLTNAWPLEDNEIDIIVANMVLQYLPDIPTFAKEARRVLKPQGLIAISVDHPSHALFMRALQLAGVPNTKFQNDLSYFETAYCIKRSLWDQAIMGYYHRPLDQYISPLLTNDLGLVVFKELGRKVEIGSITDVIPRVAILGIKKCS